MAGPFDFLSGIFGGSSQDKLSSSPNDPAYIGPIAGRTGIPLVTFFETMGGLPGQEQVHRAESERQRLTTRRDEMDERDARAALAGKAAELQAANQNAMPNDLFKMLMQDPEGRGLLMKIPAGKHGQALKDIMEGLQPTPPKYMEASPGTDVVQLGQRQGDPTQVMHSVPQTAAQQGRGRGPTIVPIVDNTGKKVGTGQLIQNEDGTSTVIPLPGAGGPRQYQHAPGAAPPPGAATPGAQPGAPAPAPQGGVPVPGQTMPGQPGGSFPPNPGPGPQVPPGQVTPDLGTPGLRKADMVDSYGWLGQATQISGGFFGNISKEAQAARQQQTHQMNQELRASFLAMNGSTRLARELKAKEGLLPPERPGADWNPYRGIDNLISLSTWTDQSMAHAESEYNNPYASSKTAEAAAEDLVRLRNFRAALGPHQELLDKKKELAEGKGGTSWEDLKKTIPGSETIGRFFGEGLDAARGAADKARGAVTPQPVAPQVSPEQFGQTLRGLDARTFAQLAAERHLMTPDQARVYAQELTRRKAEAKKGKGSVAPAPAPEPPPRKSQGRVPEGYRLPGDGDEVPPR